MRKDFTRTHTFNAVKRKATWLLLQWSTKHVCKLFTIIYRLDLRPCRSETHIAHDFFHTVINHYNVMSVSDFRFIRWLVRTIVSSAKCLFHSASRPLNHCCDWFGIKTWTPNSEQTERNQKCRHVCAWIWLRTSTAL